MALSPDDIARILGTPVDADRATVMRAYRALVAAYLPKAQADDPEARARLAEVNQAFAAYCETHPTGPVEVDPSAPIDFQQLFSSLFGTAFGIAPGGSVDLSLEMRISPTEAVAGTRRVVDVTRQLPCEPCKGTGARDGALQPCPLCDGARMQAKELGFLRVESLCARCQGRGSIPVAACGSCGGRGQRELSEPLPITVPPGISDGMTIRIDGKGAGSPPGSLFVRIAVTDELAAFERQGDDAVIAIPVGARLWLLGGTLAVPSLDGRAAVRVPRGVRDGHTVRLPGLGYARATAAAGPYRADARADGGRGDQVVVLRVPPSTPTRARASIAITALTAAGTIAAWLLL